MGGININYLVPVSPKVLSKNLLSKLKSENS